MRLPNNELTVPSGQPAAGTASLMRLIVFGDTLYDRPSSPTDCPSAEFIALVRGKFVLSEVDVRAGGCLQMTPNRELAFWHSGDAHAVIDALGCRMMGGIGAWWASA